MNTPFDIEKLIKAGILKNEFQYERALIADRKLRILSKENSKYRLLRKKLRKLIAQYENQNWATEENISDDRIRESDQAEILAEIERKFIEKRKDLIRAKLKRLNLSQQDLGIILGHKSKTYISELMNGIYPFTLRDLIVINRLLKINLSALIPTFLSLDDQLKIKSSIQELGNPKLSLRVKDLELV